MSKGSRLGLSKDTAEEIIKAYNLTQSRHQGNTTSLTIATKQYIRHRINEAIEDAENTGVPVVHVKDGKPLTEHGARLLAVPWTRRPA